MQFGTLQKKRKTVQILVLLSIKCRRGGIGNKVIIFFALSILMLFHFPEDLLYGHRRKMNCRMGMRDNCLLQGLN